MTPTSRFSPLLSPGDAATSAAGNHAPVALKEPARPPPRTPVRPTFEVRCADVHPSSCAEILRAPSIHEVVALACEHGAHVHGFTPVWYSPQRLGAIAAAAITFPS